jgi:hypothetical protein
MFQVEHSVIEMSWKNHWEGFWGKNDGPGTYRLGDRRVILAVVSNPDLI